MATVKKDIPLKGRVVSNPAPPSRAGERGPASGFRFVEEDFARDADTGQLTRDEDGFPIVERSVYHDAVVWYAGLGERINETLRAGDSFLATADLRFTEYEDKEGVRRTGHEFVIKSLGADISSGRVQIVRGPKVQAEQALSAPALEPTVAPAL